MSSMFKKKGGPAFKPRIPSARPRPAVLPAPSQPPKLDPQPEASIESISAGPSQSAPQPLVSEHSASAASEGNALLPQDSPSQQTTTPPPPDPSSAQLSAVAESLPDSHQSQDLARENEQDANNSATEQHRRRSAAIVTDVDTRLQASTSKPTAAVQQPRSTASAGTEQETALGDAQILAQLRHGLPTPSSTAPRGVTTTEVESTPTDQSTLLPTIETPQAPNARPKTRNRQPAEKTVEVGADGEEVARPRKRQRRTAQDSEAAAAKKPRKRKESSQEGTPSQTRKMQGRSVTPEDAEAQVVDLQKLKMSDLTKDLHIGKKFSRHDELRERERKARLRSKSGEPAADGEVVGTPNSDGSLLPAKKDALQTPAPSAPTPAAGPQFRIVDGQIVVDQNSLVMDRHARDAAAQGDMETIEENDFTRLITSNSFMNTSKLKGPNIWTDEETELFYRGLRMFGTDFEMISKMFPGKQRRHVKLKYNREERHCPGRIDAAVIGIKTTKLSIEEYKAFTGHDFEPVESIEAEHRKAQEDFEAEQKRIADEQAEIERKKREELFADDDEASKKKKKKGKKQTIVYGLNGEPITTGDA